MSQISKSSSTLASWILMPIIFSGSANAEHIQTVKIDAYLANHPWGGITAILRREIMGSSGKTATGSKYVEYIYQRAGGGGRFGATWSQVFENVKEVRGINTIYIPEQKLVNGGTFPGNYWCRIVDRKLFSKWAFGQCTETGMKWWN